MTRGYYKVYLTPTDRWRPDADIAKRWSLYVNTCRMLHRDGLKYNVELHLTGEHPHIVIRSSGTSAKGKVKLARMKRPLKPAIEHTTCVKRLKEATAETSQMKQRMRGRMNTGYYWKHWRYERVENWRAVVAKRVDS
jgi:hypothetical protein